MSARRFDLLLADVDGTLVDEAKRLTPEAVAAAQALRAAGIRLAVTSGRPPRGMRMLVEPLALQGPIAGFNGGVFANPDMTVIRERQLPRDVAADALSLILDQGLDAWVYTGTEWLIRDPKAPHVAREASTVQFEARVVPRFTDEHLGNVVKLVGVSDDHALVERAEQAAQGALGTRVSAARSQPYYLDVTHPDANKGAVARSLSRELGIPRERIATIGDSPNDVMMFRESGFAIAMGNASDGVKQQAQAVTAGYGENGFAQAVRRLILQEDA